MKTTLIFDSSITGHHLEYLAHLWRICEKKEDASYLFLVPRSFSKQREMIGLSECKTIKTIYLNDSEYANCNKGSIIKKAWHISRTISKYATRFSVSNVFLISIMNCLPFLPFLLRSKVRVSGIIYGIYLYSWHTFSLVKKVESVIKYSLFARSKVFENVFILNDAASARRLNALYHTDKFRYLVDPYLPISRNKAVSIRKEYCIPEDKKLFIHFGSLGIRKGTMVILDSLELFSDVDIHKYAFVFAGRIPATIKELFYSRIEAIKSKGVQIFINDAFCEYSFLGELCYECDAILIPYLDTSRSSGIIGYASQYAKPVIGPHSGLVGRLIRRYHLGYCIQKIDPHCLYDAYHSLDTQTTDLRSSEYTLYHDVQSFSEIVSVVL